MAVGPKQPDYHRPYKPDDDLSLDQIHRFTKVANKKARQEEEKAFERRIEQAIEASFNADKPAGASHGESSDNAPVYYDKQGHRYIKNPLRRFRRRHAYFYTLVCLIILVGAVFMLFS